MIVRLRHPMGDGANISIYVPAGKQINNLITGRDRRMILYEIQISPRPRLRMKKLW